MSLSSETRPINSMTNILQTHDIAELHFDYLYDKLRRFEKWQINSDGVVS